MYTVIHSLIIVVIISFIIVCSITQYTYLFCLFSFECLFARERRSINAKYECGRKYE